MFDLTTSARWQAPPVGIIRTERQLARLAPESVDLPVEYSVFDLERRAFLRLRPEVAAAILDDNLILDFTNDAVETPPKPPLADRVLWITRNPRSFVAGRLNRSGSTTAEAIGASPEKPGSIALEAAVDGVFQFGKADVLISCGLDWAHKDYQAIIEEKRRFRFAYVGVCYDTIPWKFPHFWPKGLAPTVVTTLAEMAWMSDAVMCISRSTANDFSEFCSQLQVPCPKLDVFRLGDLDYDDMARGALPATLEHKRFVLFVSSVEPRKNHRLLYNVWEDLARDPTFPDDVVLAFVGAARWMSEDLVRQIELNPLVSNRIVLVDNADDANLHALYAECLLTVFPSFYEGWGLPVAESLGHGKICLASDRGSIPEISDLTVTLSPYDHVAWREAIRGYVTDDDKRHGLESRIRERFRATTWNDCAHSFFNGTLRCLAH